MLSLPARLYVNITGRYLNNMKVKELIERLSRLDQERDIFIGYDYPHGVQVPEFEIFHFERSIFSRNEDRIKDGDYIHYAE